MMLPFFYNAQNISKTIPIDLQQISFTDWVSIEFRYKAIFFLLQGLKQRAQGDRNSGIEIKFPVSFGGDLGLLLLGSANDTRDKQENVECLLDNLSEERSPSNKESLIGNEEANNLRKAVRFVEDQFDSFSKIRDLKNINAKLLNQIFSLEKYKEGKFIILKRKRKAFNKITILAPNTELYLETIPNTVYDYLQKKIYLYAENAEKLSNSYLLLTLGCFSIVFPERHEPIRFGLFRSVFPLNAPDQLLFMVSVSS